MILPDVNILVYAFNKASTDHSRFRSWLLELLRGAEPYALADIILSGFLRVSTNPRIFDPPSSLDEALEFVDEIRARPNCQVIEPGPRHWNLFTDLCRRSRSRGDLIADAYIAALAIESGSELITTDRDFARFPGLRWRPPFE